MHVASTMTFMHTLMLPWIICDWDELRQPFGKTEGVQAVETGVQTKTADYFHKVRWCQLKEEAGGCFVYLQKMIWR
jgi:hypothetical protein